MNITSINNTNPNFGITRKVRLAMKDGTTTILNVVGEEVKGRSYPRITRIFGEVMHKGKTVKQVKDYHNKKGFDDQRFAVICEELSKGTKEPDTVMDKILDSVEKPRIDYNV